MGKVIGGNLTTGRPSKIAQMIATNLGYNIFNGKRPSRISGDVTIWMPHIENEEAKDYPVKDKGSILICSKVMRDGYTNLEAVSRIFRMHGNAVIAIYRDDDVFRFELLDALNNSWCNTTSIDELCASIKVLISWTKGADRRSLKFGGYLDLGNFTELDDFISINNRLADRVQASVGERYFGNLSARMEPTRCMRLFPAMRKDRDLFAFSPRNSDKSALTAGGMVAVQDGQYCSKRKPSVDTPVQMDIFDKYPDINYIIHGHAHVKHAPTTASYYPCGDMREVPVTELILDAGYRVLNLKNHGFLICASTLDELERYIAAHTFETR